MNGQDLRFHNTVQTMEWRKTYVIQQKEKVVQDRYLKKWEGLHDNKKIQTGTGDDKRHKNDFFKTTFSLVHNLTLWQHTLRFEIIWRKCKNLKWKFARPKWYQNTITASRTYLWWVYILVSNGIHLFVLANSPVTRQKISYVILITELLRTLSHWSIGVFRREYVNTVDILHSRVLLKIILWKQQSTLIMFTS